MPEIDKDLMTYKDVTELDLIPSKDFVGFTDTILLIQNDASRRATLHMLLDKLKDAVTVVNGKSAYEIAVDHGFKGSEEEWLESLGTNDLRAVVGNYVVVDAGWSGNSLVPVDPDSPAIPEGATAIYQVKQKDGTYLYYTINKQGNGYDKWNGILPMVVAMEKVVKSFIPDILYYSDRAYTESVVGSSIPPLSTHYIRKFGDGSVWEPYFIPTSGDFGHIYQIIYNDAKEGVWKYNTYGTLHDYEGIAQYIQALIAEYIPPKATNAETANTLKTSRKITLNNSENAMIGSTMFDGSQNVTIKFIEGSINAALLAKTNNKVSINISGFADKLATPREISLTGLVTGKANFDGSKNVEIATKVDTTNLVAGKATELENVVNLEVVGGGSNTGNTVKDNTTGAISYYSDTGKLVYTWYPNYATLINKYDGKTKTQIVLTHVDTKVLTGDTPAEIDITGTAGSAKTLKATTREIETNMLLTGIINDIGMSGGTSVLVDSEIYVEHENSKGNKNTTEAGKPTIVSPQFNGNLIGNADTATKADTVSTSVRENDKQMLLVGIQKSEDMSGGKSILRDSNIYVEQEDTSGTHDADTGKTTIVSPQFNGNLIGNADTATKATKAEYAVASDDYKSFRLRNIYLGTDTTPPIGANNGDIYFQYDQNSY